MHTFLEGLKERNFQNKTVALIENGSWAPMAAKVMKDILKPCKNLVFLDPVVKIFSSPSEENREQIDKIVNKFTSAYAALNDAKPNQLDDKALFKLGYGLYVVTTGDGQKDNGCIINTVTQLTDKPLKVAVNINKANYSHHLAKETGKLNVNVLTEDTPFSVFETFGFKSGRNTDKFEGVEYKRTNNGLVALTKNTNAVISLKVDQYVDLDTHGMFICSVTESVILSDKTSMTYDYYHKHVKPQPNAAKGWVCEICGFVYEGEEVPEDYICPLCKHGKEAFRKI
jgi:flavin reductase (DIM6/NTAB) family NADH-FMN oxidoreductase RutF